MAEGENARFDGGVDLEMRVEEGEDCPRRVGRVVITLHECGQLRGDARKAALETALVSERVAQGRLVWGDVGGEAQHLFNGVHLNEPECREFFAATIAPHADVEIGERFAQKPFERVFGSGTDAGSDERFIEAVCFPDDATGGEGNGGEFLRLEDGVFGKDAIFVEDFAAIDGVLEAVGDGGCEPAEVVEEALFAARLDYGEEVEVGIGVKALLFAPNRAEREQGKRRPTVAQGGGNCIETS